MLLAIVQNAIPNRIPPNGLPNVKISVRRTPKKIGFKSSKGPNIFRNRERNWLRK